MRDYELITIFPSIEEDKKVGLEAILAELKSKGAINIKETDLGDRTLAYDIKKQSRGHYYQINLSLDSQSILPVEQAFRLNQRLLKHLFVLVD